MPFNNTFLAVVGLTLSLYAVYVEYKMEHINNKSSDDGDEESFTALCDIEAIGASCSSTFSLPEGRLLSYWGILDKGSVLDLPNAALGSGYYIAMLLPILLPMFFKKCLSVVALVVSIYLAFKLTILKELCILCWTTHVINACLFWNLWIRRKSSSGEPKKNKMA